MQYACLHFAPLAARLVYHADLPLRQAGISEVGVTCIVVVVVASGYSTCMSDLL